MGAGDSSLLAYQEFKVDSGARGRGDNGGSEGLGNLSGPMPDSTQAASSYTTHNKPAVSRHQSERHASPQIIFLLLEQEQWWLGWGRKTCRLIVQLPTVPGALDLHLYQLFEQWQETAATRVCKTQRGIEGEIEGVEALELKLLQRLNFASSVIKSTAVHLQDVYPLRFEVAQMQRNLQATIQSYNGLCAKIEKLEFSLLKDRPRWISLLGDSRLAASAPKKVEASQPPSASSSY